MLYLLVNVSRNIFIFIYFRYLFNILDIFFRNKRNKSLLTGLLYNKIDLQPNRTVSRPTYNYIRASRSIIFNKLAVIFNKFVNRNNSLIIPVFRESCSQQSNVANNIL